ncbi:MAG: ABC transporter permease, partial [Firmicutes bacterium]|nr:ABC transporter permease [Bacillota bacterium]
ITERIREIATIKVLGFYENETAKYVFREITMLSAGGSFVGLFMGKALHAFVMAQIQVDNMFFPVQIKPVSYLASVVLTMFFSWLITRFMKPRLDKIDMAESLKSIE